MKKYIIKTTDGTITVEASHHNIEDYGHTLVLYKDNKVVTKFAWGFYAQFLQICWDDLEEIEDNE